MAVKVSGSDGVNQSQVTGATQLPVGTTAQRPPDPAAGMMRFNTDTGQVEGYNIFDNGWQQISNFFARISATGGTVTDITQDGQIFRVHTFTTDGTFEVTSGDGEVDVLVVAGGGGAGFDEGGGGGAGGLVFATLGLLPSAYSVTVGSGGAGSGEQVPGDNGEDSLFGSLITAIGGGGGGSNSDISIGSGAQDGGSGGGHGGNNTGTSIFPIGQGVQPSQSGISGTNGFGNNGGDKDSGFAERHSGGGGGAGSPGEDGTQGSPGNGGEGLDFSATFGSSFGDNGNFAGGGAGTGRGSAGGSAGLGGIGGGGDGSAVGNGLPGEPNTGGGGGGGTNIGGNGGSGIVIVRYRIG